MTIAVIQYKAVPSRSDRDASLSQKRNEFCTWFHAKNKKPARETIPLQTDQTLRLSTTDVKRISSMPGHVLKECANHLAAIFTKPDDQFSVFQITHHHASVKEIISDLPEWLPPHCTAKSSQSTLKCTSWYTYCKSSLTFAYHPEECTGDAISSGFHLSLLYLTWIRQTSTVC